MNKEALKTRKTIYGGSLIRISKLPSDLSAFKQCRNTLRSLTRQLRNNFERKLADNVNVNLKAFWKYVNSHLGSKSSIDDLSLSGDTVAQSDKEKADAFNDFFAVSLPLRTLACCLISCGLCSSYSQ